MSDEEQTGTEGDVVWDVGAGGEMRGLVAAALLKQHRIDNEPAGWVIADVLHAAGLLIVAPDPEDVEISWSIVHNGTGNPAISQTDCYDEESAREIANRYPGRTLYRVTTTTTTSDEEIPL